MNDWEYVIKLAKTQLKIYEAKLIEAKDAEQRIKLLRRSIDNFEVNRVQNNPFPGEARLKARGCFK